MVRKKKGSSDLASPDREKARQSIAEILEQLSHLDDMKSQACAESEPDLARFLQIRAYVLAEYAEKIRME